MLKSLGLLFLSLFVTPAMVNVVGESFDNEVNYTLDSEDEIDPEEYTYETTYDGYDVVVTLDSNDFGPTVKKTFMKPCGYRYTLDIQEEQAFMIATLAKYHGLRLGAENPLSTFDVDVTYAVNNAYVQSENLFGPCDGSVDYYKTMLLYTVPDSLLMELPTIETDAYVTPALEARIRLPDPEPGKMSFLLFRIPGKNIEIHPVNTESIINLTMLYVDLNGTKPTARFHADVLSGFFNESPTYNNYGYKTLTTTPHHDSIKGDDGWYCYFKLELIAFDSIPIGNLNPHTNTTGLGVLIDVPDEPLEVKARLRFTDEGGESHEFFSKPITIQRHDAYVMVDDFDSRTTLPRGSEHKFNIYAEKIPYGEFKKINIELTARPDRLNDQNLGYELYGDKTLPSVGEPDKYYYEPSGHEKELYNQSKLEELQKLPYEGVYKTWNSETNSYDIYNGVPIIDRLITDSSLENLNKESFYQLFEGIATLPFAGRWKFDVLVNIEYKSLTENSVSIFDFTSQSQMIEAVDIDALGIHIESNVPDSFNLIKGAGEIDVFPSLSEKYDSSELYYDWSLSKEGVVEIGRSGDPHNGKITINPVNNGLVTLKATCESQYFTTLVKEINVRVLDSIYGSSKIVVPEEFHYSNKDLTAAVEIRGFTKFLNLNVKWEIQDKKGNPLDESKYKDNGDATVTLIKPESNDYTIKASFEDVELDAIKLSVRDINLNAFLRVNIWWIVLLTAGLVVLMLFLNKLTKMGKTTLQQIERVYQVFCNCMSNDTLSKEEVKRIRRETAKCLRRVENMNVDALNQYEKATRYLRLSLQDTKALYDKYDKLSLEERTVMTDKLDHDLSKALSFAKEIENAKELIEAYHASANARNFETIQNEKQKKNKK